jgi:hypothetical protein
MYGLDVRIAALRNYECIRNFRIPCRLRGVALQRLATAILDVTVVMRISDVLERKCS